MAQMCRLLESISRRNYQQSAHQDLLTDPESSYVGEGVLGESGVEIVEQAPSPTFTSDTGDSSEQNNINDVAVFCSE